MVSKIISILVIVFFLFSGCGSSNIGMQYKFIEPNFKVENSIGYLKVYTFNYEDRNALEDDRLITTYKGYSIYNSNGDYIFDVHKSYGSPEIVKLREGEYVIIAELQKNIIHSFLVQIQSGKILEIDKSMLEKM